jgi:hypothetical protein
MLEEAAANFQKALGMLTALQTSLNAALASSNNAGFAELGEIGDELERVEEQMEAIEERLEEIKERGGGDVMEEGD